MNGHWKHSDIEGIIRQNLLFARHVANEYGGWVKIVKQFRMSHKPMGQASEGDSIINNNFTFTRLTFKSV